MKKIILAILVLLSVQSFAQTKLYAIRINIDNTRDTFNLKIGTDSLFNTSNQFVQFSKEHFEGQFNPTYPNGFDQYFKRADDVWVNRLTPNPIYSVSIHSDATANITLTSQANSEQPLANNQRSAVRIVTNGYSQVRVTAIVMALSNSVNSPRIYLQYSTDAVNWIGDGVGWNISLSSTGAKETAWIDIPVGAVGDVYVRVAQNGGNGTASPQLGHVTIQFR